MAKYRIKKSPTGSMKAGGNTRSTQYTGNMIYPMYKPNMMAEPSLEERTTLSAVPRDEANLEAEKNETALLPDVGGLSAHYKIGGKRHSQGGTPLNLPEDAFIFSDTSTMKIKDPKLLAYFGKTNKKGTSGITPADIAKQYDINTYRKTLADKTIDDSVQIRTAENMIANYNLKLAKLGLIQESMKGFPQGIPAIALPYLATNSIDPGQILPLKDPEETGEQMSEQEQGEMPMGKYGMQYSKLMKDGGQMNLSNEEVIKTANSILTMGDAYPLEGYNKLSVLDKRRVNNILKLQNKSEGGPLHAGSQPWANFGNALMQDGGAKPWYHYPAEALNAIGKGLTYAGESIPYAIDYASGHGNRFAPKYEFPSDYYDRVQNELDPEHLDNRPVLSPNSKIAMNVLSDPGTYLGVTGSAKAIGSAATPIGKGIAGATEYLTGLSQKALLELMDMFKTTNYKELLKTIAKGVDPVLGRVAPILSKFNAEQPTAPIVPTKPYISAQSSTYVKPVNVPQALPQVPDTTADAEFNRLLSKRYGGDMQYAKEGTQVGDTYKGQAITKAGVSKSGDTIIIAGGKAYTIPANKNIVKQKEVTATTKAKDSPSVVETPEQSATRSASFDKSYKFLQQTLANPKNEGLRNELYKRWKSIPENKNKSDSKDEVINNLLKAQKHIFDIQKSYPTKQLKDKTWDKGTKINQTYDIAAKKLGFDPMNKKEIEDFQATYRVLQDLADEPEYSELLNKFQLSPVGLADQTYGKGSKAISPIDGWFGNTTVGQALLVKPEALQEKLKGKLEEDQKPLDTSYTPEAYNPPINAPWWTQDVIKTAGAAGDFMRIKKYLPWSPVVSPYVPDPTFYDPTREIAANAEQANIQTQGASTFGNPQQFGAVAASIQGNAAKNIADVLGKYNNLNVGVANQFSGIRADIMNRANESNAANATSLYDKTTMANQNFDNAKNMAREQLRTSYIDAITNRANAQVLNTMYPNYQIDPSTGGMMSFYKGSKLNPRNPQDQYVMEAERFKQAKILDPTVTWKDVFGKNKQDNNQSDDFIPPGYRR